PARHAGRAQAGVLGRVGGAEEGLDDGGVVAVGVGDRVALHAVVEVVLLDVRVEAEPEGHVVARHAARRVSQYRRQRVRVRRRIAVDGDAYLLEVVTALDAGGGLTDLLHRGQEQADEDGDDGYHHQKLDQREAAASSVPGSAWDRTDLQAPPALGLWMG